jgi:CheY-like chemotaxis protein
MRFDRTHTSEPTVLIVDDNALLRASLVAEFEDAGYVVVQACDGKDALRVMAIQQPDVIVMDIKMPVLDGIEATRQLRAIAGFAQIPVIAFSGDAISINSARHLFNAILPKPCLPVEVVAAVEQLLHSATSA